MGSEKIVLGCTELAVMLDNENLPLINTVDVLVMATMSAMRELVGDDKMLRQEAE